MSTHHNGRNPYRPKIDVACQPNRKVSKDNDDGGGGQSCSTPAFLTPPPLHSRVYINSACRYKHWPAPSAVNSVFDLSRKRNNAHPSCRFLAAPVTIFAPMGRSHYRRVISRQSSPFRPLPPSILSSQSQTQRQPVRDNDWEIEADSQASSQATFRNLCLSVRRIYKQLLITCHVKSATTTTTTSPSSSSGAPTEKHDVIRKARRRYGRSVGSPKGPGRPANW